MLLTLETISACLSALDADDAPLRATISLRLAILQADFRGDRRKACQVRHASALSTSSLALLLLQNKTNSKTK